MNKKHVFPEVMRQVVMATIFSMGFAVTHMMGQRSNALLYVVIIVYALANYLVNYLFLKKERTLILAAVINLISFAVCFIILLMLGEIVSVGTGIYIAVAIGVITVLGYYCVSKGIQLNNLSIPMDGLIILVIIYVFMGSLKHVNFPDLWVGIFGIICALLGMAVYRMDKNAGIKEFLPTIILLVIAVGAGILIYCFAINPLGTGFKEVWGGIAYVFSSAGKMISRFFLFIASLLPEPEYDDGQMEALEGMEMSGGAIEEESNGNPLVVLIILGVLVLAGVIVYFVFFAKKRIRMNSKRKQLVKKPMVSERKKATEVFKNLILKIKKSIRLKMFLFRHRNEPIGRFYKIVRKCNHTTFEKIKGETPQAFLQRYAGGLKKAGKKAEIEDLVNKLNIQLYSK